MASYLDYSDEQSPPPPYTAPSTTYSRLNGAPPVTYHVAPQQQGYPHHQTHEYSAYQPAYGNAKRIAQQFGSPSLEVQHITQPAHPSPHQSIRYDPNHSPSLTPQLSPRVSPVPGLRPQYSPQYSPNPGPRISPYASPSLAPQINPNHVPSLVPQQTQVPQELVLHYQRTSTSSGEILGPDKRAVMYTCRTHHWSKPHMTLHTPNGQGIGSMTMHSLSTRIDLVLHNQPLTLEANGMFRSGYHFTSRAGNGTLKWKNDGLSGSAKVMLNNWEQAVARFKVRTFSLKSEGEITILQDGLKHGPALEELLLSLLTELYVDSVTAAAGVAGAAAGS